MKSIKYLFILLILSSNLVLPQSPYTILISFDGFRWDYLNREITPHLQNEIKKGVNAISLRPTFPSKTFPNHYSIITGQHAVNNGIISNNIYDPVYKEKYKLSNREAVQEARWYSGEAFWETAERQGIKTASFFWPGSEVKLKYRRPSYYHEYDHHLDYRKRVDGVFEWLNLPNNERPKFITLYFDLTDTYGHKYGPNSEENNWAISSLDSITAYLREKCNQSTLKDSINLIFVSDHGMTETSENRIINLKNIINNFECRISDYGPFMTIEPEESKIEELYKALKDNEHHYKVYKKEDIPDYYHYKSSHLVPSLFLIANLGWSLELKDDFGKYGSKGNHGYEKDQIDMHGIFIANGPSFRKGYKTGTLWNIDLYPLLCKIYNIYPKTNIDGKLERIEFILKQK